MIEYNKAEKKALRVINKILKEAERKQFEKFYE